MGFEKFGQGAETGLGGLVTVTVGKGSAGLFCVWVKRDRIDIIVGMVKRVCWMCTGLGADGTAKRQLKGAGSNL
jgi:hypothetical protein